jgi:hypothetical protein
MSKNFGVYTVGGSSSEARSFNCILPVDIELDLLFRNTALSDSLYRQGLITWFVAWSAQRRQQVAMLQTKFARKRGVSRLVAPPEGLCGHVQTVDT